MATVLAPIDEDPDALMLQGDKLTFVSIFEKHHRWIYALCLRMLRSPDEADDAAQEVFARALESLDKLEHIERLAGWLKAIAINYCRSVIQQKRHCTSFDFDLIPSSIPNAEHSLIQSEKRELVGKLIDRLPPNQRLVFVMKYIDRYSYKQIQAFTGFSDKQVKSYLQNARRNFVNWWQAERIKDGSEPNKRPLQVA